MAGRPSGTIGNIVSGVVTPILAKHSKNFSRAGAVSVGVDRVGIRRNFEALARPSSPSAAEPSLYRCSNSCWEIPFEPANPALPVSISQPFVLKR
jgi:hypothetical protein